jgi:hypothetical protein
MQLRDRRILVPLGGAAVALVAGGLIGWGMLAPHRDERAAPPPASQGGLVIDPTARNDAPVDPARSLRCFVDGQFVGEMSLAVCAQKNGVATEALDVGVDGSGALAAASQPGTVLTPLPPVQQAAALPQVAAPAATPQPLGAPAGACWRYADGKWGRLPADLTLNACVQTLFAGHCERQGSATYGRWMQQTLRLVPGRIEVSGDNRSFRTLAEQGPGCVTPPIG